MASRSVILITPNRMDQSVKEDVETCLDFRCGLNVQSLVEDGQHIKAYINTTGYDKKAVREMLQDTDYIDSFEIIV